jgi:multidrug efflux pump subunit AcrA (membrane-fusion protein)
MARKLLLPIVVLLLVAGGVAYVRWSQPTALVLTGIVTTNDVIVSPQISGQISKLLVNDGDQVKRDQLIAVITPDESPGKLAADDPAKMLGMRPPGSRQCQLSSRGRRRRRWRPPSPRKSAEADRENARLVFERNQKMVAQTS